MPKETVIEPNVNRGLLDWRELGDYRDLVYFLVWRDVKVLYKQTVLGLAWAVIRPTFSMVVFTIVFGGLAGVPSDGAPYAVFSFAALVPWTYFSTAMTKSAESLVANANMLTKIYFPRAIIPVTPVLAGLVDFAVAFVILLLLMAFYGVMPTAMIVLLPLYIVIMIVTAVGVGLWLSAMTIQYRDVKHASTFLTQLLMYAAPVVWPASLIMEKFPQWGETIRWIYGLYPMAGVVEGFRAVLLGTVPVPWDLTIAGALSAVAILLSGAAYFRRMERFFADVA